MMLHDVHSLHVATVTPAHHVRTLSSVRVSFSVSSGFSTVALLQTKCCQSTASQPTTAHDTQHTPPLWLYLRQVWSADGTTHLGTSASQGAGGTAPPLRRTYLTATPWDGTFFPAESSNLPVDTNGLSKLKPGRTYKLKVELWPVLAAGDRLAGRQASDMPLVFDIGSPLHVQSSGGIDRDGRVTARTTRRSSGSSTSGSGGGNGGSRNTHKGRSSGRRGGRSRARPETVVPGEQPDSVQTQQQQSRLVQGDDVQQLQQHVQPQYVQPQQQRQQQHQQQQVLPAIEPELLVDQTEVDDDVEEGSALLLSQLQPAYVSLML